MIPAYSQTVCEEIEYITHSVMGILPIHTIYFGGGTPSLVPETKLGDILTTIKNHFQLSPNPEITLEANPGTVSKEYFEIIHNLGVNRISLGMQSANQNELTLLERQHSYEDVVNAVDWARAAGINNLNLDLIFGLPDQELKSWLTSLKAALSLNPEHLSLYALTLEHGTPMQKQVQAGTLAEPDPDIAADMYEAADEILSKAGYVQYEISNWARVNNQGELLTCKHNQQYWRNLPYLGVGAGAHGFINHYRTVNVMTPSAYINRMRNMPEHPGGINPFPRTPATMQMHTIDINTEIGETMMMALRLIMEGVSNVEFQQRFGISLQERFGTQIERLISIGLLEWNNFREERLRLTQKGRLLGNQVFMEFI
jgi:oxygen-independent coproporphyrinogen-3 oxidase